MTTKKRQLAVGEWVKSSAKKEKYWHEFPFGRVSSEEGATGYTKLEVIENGLIVLRSYPTRGLIKFIPSEEEKTSWSLARIKT